MGVGAKSVIVTLSSTKQVGITLEVTLTVYVPISVKSTIGLGEVKPFGPVHFSVKPFTSLTSIFVFIPWHFLVSPVKVRSSGRTATTKSAVAEVSLPLSTLVIMALYSFPGASRFSTLYVLVVVVAISVQSCVTIGLLCQ